MLCKKIFGMLGVKWSEYKTTLAKRRRKKLFAKMNIGKNSTFCHILNFMPKERVETVIVE